MNIINPDDPSRPEEKKNDGGGGLGSYYEELGDPSQALDPTRQLKNDDLSSMYVKATGDKERKVAMRARMESAPEKARMSGGAFMGLIFLGGVALVVAFLFITKATVLDEQGIPSETNSLNWIIHRFTRSDRVATLEGMSDRLRGFFLTRERVQLIYAIASEKYARSEPVPSPEEMAQQGLIKGPQKVDAWGSPIVVEVVGRVRVISVGEDARPGTGDEISMDGGNLSIPMIYQQLELEESSASR